MHSFVEFLLSVSARCSHMRTEQLLLIAMLITLLAAVSLMRSGRQKA